MKSWTKLIRDDSIPLICLRWLEKTKNITHIMVEKMVMNPMVQSEQISLETNLNTLDLEVWLDPNKYREEHQTSGELQCLFFFLCF